MDVNEIITEVAKRNRVVLAPTDPVMVIATIAELQIAGGRKVLATVVTEALDQASAGTEQQIEAARKIGAAISTGVARWSANQIRQAGERAAARVRAEVVALDHHAAKGRAESGLCRLGRRSRCDPPSGRSRRLHARVTDRITDESNYSLIARRLQYGRINIR